MKKLEDILESWETSKYLSPKVKDKIKDQHEKLIQHYQGHTDQEKTNLSYYSDSSKDINSALWERHKTGKENTEYSRANAGISALDSALKRHKTPDSFTVYSGTVHDPRELKNSEGIVHHPAYLSTSIDPNISENFALKNQTQKNETIEYGIKIPHYERHLMKFDVPKDHHGSYYGKYEKEFIMPRGTNLQHIKTTKTSGTKTHPKFRNKE
jgi:hypothetical protein